MAEFFRAKAIEEKMGNDQVVGSGSVVVVECIGVDERDFFKRDISRHDVVLRDSQHALTGIDAGHPRMGKTLPKGSEELARALTENEDRLRRSEAVQMRDAAGLEFSPGEERFHPAIMRSDGIEAHAGWRLG